jgi:hypothetical protein
MDADLGNSVNKTAIQTNTLIPLNGEELKEIVTLGYSRWWTNNWTESDREVNLPTDTLSKAFVIVFDRNRIHLRSQSIILAGLNVEKFLKSSSSVFDDRCGAICAIRKAFWRLRGLLLDC